MRPLRILACVLIIIAVLLTGTGGLLDMTAHDFQITRRHMWNDGLFMAILAVFVLLWDMKP
jgi:hypothetical protein